MSGQLTQRQQLEAEFPPQMLSTTPKGGKRLTYVPVHEVVQRMNDVLGPNWSWEVARIWRDELDPDWVLAYGVLTATIDGGTVTVSGSGGVKVSRTQSSGELVDLGDEFKGAESDAMKKACQRLGVGLYLSRDAEAIAYEAPKPTRDPIAEGWESAEQAKAMNGQLGERIKSLPDEPRAAVKAFSAEIGVVWPPTREEHERLLERVQKVEEEERLAWCGLDDCPDRRHPWNLHTDHLRAVHGQETPASDRELQDSHPTPPDDPEVVWASSELAAEVTRYVLGLSKEGTKAWTQYAKAQELPAQYASYTEAQAQSALDFLMALPADTPAR